MELSYEKIVKELQEKPEFSSLDISLDIPGAEKMEPEELMSWLKMLRGEKPWRALSLGNWNGFTEQLCTALLQKDPHAIICVVDPFKPHQYLSRTILPGQTFMGIVLDVEDRNNVSLMETFYPDLALIPNEPSQSLVSRAQYLMSHSSIMVIEDPSVFNKQQLLEGYPPSLFVPPVFNWQEGKLHLLPDISNKETNQILEGGQNNGVF